MRCGQDCSGRPRVKDQQGRYCCKACAEKQPTARASASVHQPSEPTSAPPEPQEAAWDAGLDALEFEPVVLPESSLKVCMGCGLPMQPGAVICVSCGTNQSTGQPAGPIVVGQEKPAQPSKPLRVCSKCGYDLAGLKTPKCPECGTVNLKRKRGLDLDREAAEKAYKWEYIKPLIILGVCGAIEAAVLFSNYRGTELLGATVLSLLRVPVGILVYFACAFAWLGFENTFKLTIVKLLGVFAAVSLATTVSLLIPFGIYRLSLSYFVQIWMLSDLMDMEYSDAAFASAITSVGLIAAYFAMAYAFA